jgi:hypothetical protein
VLVNLGRAAQVGYQQVTKFDTKTRLVASHWEQETVLAECADGDEARALIDRIARAMAQGTVLLDLRVVDVAPDRQ